MNAGCLQEVLQALALPEEAVLPASEQLTENMRFVMYRPTVMAHPERDLLDELFRFSDLVVLDRLTGVRLLYSVQEDYTGEQVVYKAYRLFVQTSPTQVWDVLDINLKTWSYYTSEGWMSFRDVSRQAETNFQFHAGGDAVLV